MNCALEAWSSTALTPDTKGIVAGVLSSLGISNDHMLQLSQSSVPLERAVGSSARAKAALGHRVKMCSLLSSAASEAIAGEHTQIAASLATAAASAAAGATIRPFRAIEVRVTRCAYK